MESIDALAQAAFARLWQWLLDHPGSSPRAAIKAAQAQFTGAFAEALAASFSELLRRAVGVAEVLALPVGAITLSARLHGHGHEVVNEVTALIREHAKGVLQARELSRRLYDGYNPADGIRRPLEGRARAELPKALRSLTDDLPARRELTAIQVAGQKQAARLKSQALKAAYMESFDGWVAGEGQDRLQRRLEVAQREKNRFVAERIARTELHRAHQTQVAAELMADEETTVVQVRMNPAHPKTDICDMHARADLFGLGPGNYPKAKAPRPPFHPHCWCRLRSRPSLFSSPDRQPIPGAEAAYLRTLTDEQAAQVMGSAARRDAVLRGGASVREVVDAGKPRAYRTVLIGEPGGIEPPLARGENAQVPTSYEIATHPGGKHHGFLRQLPSMGPRQRNKSMRSFKELVSTHLDKIAFPEKYVSGWSGYRESHQQSLLREWRKEVLDHQQQIEILKEYGREHD